VGASSFRHQVGPYRNDAAIYGTDGINAEGVAAVVSIRRVEEVSPVWHEPTLRFQSVAIRPWRVKAGCQGASERKQGASKIVTPHGREARCGVCDQFGVSAVGELASGNAEVARALGSAGRSAMQLG